MTTVTRGAEWCLLSIGRVVARTVSLAVMGCWSAGGGGVAGGSGTAGAAGSGASTVEAHSAAAAREPDEDTQFVERRGLNSRRVHGGRQRSLRLRRSRVERVE